MDEMEILAKEFVALKIQSHFKRKQAKIQVQKMRLNTRAITIQKYLKGYVKHRSAQKLVFEWVMIRRI